MLLVLLNRPQCYIGAVRKGVDRFLSDTDCALGEDAMLTCMLALPSQQCLVCKAADRFSKITVGMWPLKEVMSWQSSIMNKVLTLRRLRMGGGGEEVERMSGVLQKYLNSSRTISHIISGHRDRRQDLSGSELPVELSAHFPERGLYNYTRVSKLTGGLFH